MPPATALGLSGGGRGTDVEATARLLAEAVTRIDAPDLVLAFSGPDGRIVLTGGTAPAPGGGVGPAPGGGAGPGPGPLGREHLRYEIGSVSKTYTVLLYADLVRRGIVGLDDALLAHLPRELSVRARRMAAREITLRHLATHTAGLPRVPAALLPGAVLRPYASGYDAYDTARLLDAFARTPLRHRPGTHWAYSNFGVALLAAALEHAAGEPYPILLARHVLGPLNLTSTSTAPGPRGAVAPGHRKDGRTPVLPARMGAFAPVAAIRATPDDLLTYLEAQLDPESTPLAAPLLDAQVPQLTRGPAAHRETHTLTWFQHPGPRGPLLFHGGATFGQQAFLGFHRPTGTALAALATRRGHSCGLMEAAYGALSALASGGRDTGRYTSR